MQPSTFASCLDAWITRDPHDRDPACPGGCGGDCDPYRDDGVCADCRAEMALDLAAHEGGYLALLVSRDECDALDREASDTGLPAMDALDREERDAARGRVERRAERRRERREVGR